MPLNYKGVTLKDGLIKQCKDRNLDSSGNRLHLVQRLEADDIAKANNDKTNNDNDGKDDSNNNSDSNDKEEEEDNDHNVPDSNSSNKDSDNNSGNDSNEGEDEEDNNFDPSNVAARKEKFEQETKEGKRIRAKEARAVANAEVKASNADYCNAGIPRKLADLVALGDNLLVEKMEVESRNAAELLTGECFEREGKLMKKSIKKSFVISFKCSNPGCNNLHVTWRRQAKTGKWILAKFAWVHSCGGAVAPLSMSFGSCAYDWKQLVGLVVPLVTMDPSIT
jgi:hypothetical protein